MPLLAGLAVPAGAGATSWPTMLRYVEHAEELGLHSVWVPEGHFRQGGTPSPLVALSAFAVRTRHLRLATTSLLLPIHPPARVAAETAALDLLSRGRLILGLGRGFQEPVLRAFGVVPAQKRDRFDAALDTILEIWASREAGGQTGPLQRPHPPLAVAAFGRKGLLQAARRALPYLASPLETLPTLEANLSFYRENLARPLPPGIAVPVMRTVHVAEDDEEAHGIRLSLEAENRRLVRGVRGALARAAAGPLHERTLVGTEEAVGESLLRYRERLGMDLVVVRPALGLAPVEACLDSLTRLRENVLPSLPD